MIELSMLIFHGISQRKLRFPGALSPKPLWKPVGLPGSGEQGQVEGTLQEGSRKDNCFAEVGMSAGCQGMSAQGPGKLLFNFEMPSDL